jgi:hypothetical protein
VAARSELDASSAQALFDMFGGRVTLRPAQTEGGDDPFLIARVGINRAVLLAAARERKRLCHKW